MSKIENAVKFMERIAADETHGYAQDNRNGIPDYDCSSLVGSALFNSGFKVNPASTTRNLYKQLIKCGFKEISIDAPRMRGDIFLTPGKHVVMCTDANNIAHASLNEKKTIKNGQPGDQTGKEICIRSFYSPSYQWTYHLRYEETNNTSPILRGVDVSSIQKDIDWPKVKASGIHFVILRGTLKSGKPDPKFVANYDTCTMLGLNVGVYKYSYALNEQAARDEAMQIVRLLDGRKCKVWLDLEDKSQIALGKEGILKIAQAFIKICETNGLQVGIYCNLNWFKNYIDDSLKTRDIWIARYGKNNGTLDNTYKPNIGETIWQYSSKGSVSGIDGFVDVNVAYKAEYGFSTAPVITNLVNVKTCLNVRNKPNGTIIGKLYNNMVVKILDYKDGWYRIGEDEWVSANYISSVQGSVMAYSLNVRSGPSTSYDSIDVIKENTTVKIVDYQGGWYNVFYDGKRGWVSSKYIILKGRI